MSAIRGQSRTLSESPPVASRGSEKSRGGLTLVELLAVIVIVAMLMGLLLPAVQSAREASRQTICRNNLKQIGVAAHAHESTNRFFPSGGWGYAWAGDPDRGFGKNQPGSWVYSLLPFLEATALWQLGGGQPWPAKSVAVRVVAGTPLAVMNCPTRRSQGAYPPGGFVPCNAATSGVASPASAKTDYAISNGVAAGIWAAWGPAFPSGGLAPNITPSGPWDCVPGNGISSQRSEVTAAHVVDGLASTYLVGEKYLMVGGAMGHGDNETMYSGVNDDSMRQAGQAPFPDTPGFLGNWWFGSSHAASCNMVFCDGSVRAISYSIDVQTHRNLAQRNDRQLVDEAKF